MSIIMSVKVYSVYCISVSGKTIYGNYKPHLCILLASELWKKNFDKAVYTLKKWGYNLNFKHFISTWNKTKTAVWN